MCCELPAKLSPGSPPAFGVLATKGVQLPQLRQRGGIRARDGRGEVLSPPGQEYDKFSLKLLNAATGFQGFVEFKQLSSGREFCGRSCVFRHFQCCLSLHQKFSSKIQEREEMKTKLQKKLFPRLCVSISLEQNRL